VEKELAKRIEEEERIKEMCKIGVSPHFPHADSHGETLGDVGSRSLSVSTLSEKGK